MSQYMYGKGNYKMYIYTNEILHSLFNRGEAREVPHFRNQPNPPSI